MRNLRFYETDAAFKAYEQGAGGDGNSTKTSIPGVSNTWDLGKTYFNPHDEAKLTHTVTVNYKNKYGDTIAESDSVEIKYFDGVEQDVIVYSKNIDNYKEMEFSKTVTIPEDNSVTFIYDILDYSLVPLAFNIISAGTIYWKASSAPSTKTIKYKKNDGDWTSISSTIVGASISVNAGDIIQFKGDNATYGDSSNNRSSFSGSTAKFEIEGNIMSLIDSSGYTTATTLASSNTFNFLFSFCTGLISAENLMLPATTLAQSCYKSMFSNCTSLTTAPELPATTLAGYCYSYIFVYCTSLTTAPELPATTLADGCYYSMFSNCTSLTTAPELPATTLATYCYNGMFQGCTSLTSAPVLPATTLAVGCYASMFAGCISLTTAPELPVTTLANECYSGMFNSCRSLTTAPELPATTLAFYCYYRMFYGCLSLNYIKCLATDISATNCTREWVYDIASSGTFVKNPNMISWPITGYNGIPLGWTVEDA